MNNSVYYISLDIHDTASQTMLNVKKSDNGRQINFVLTDGGKPYVITEGCKAYFRALKPSKENLLFNECTIANNVITYILTNQTSAEVGIVDCEIRLNGADGKQITSPRFSLCVEDIIYSDSEVESKDEFTALQAALEKAENLIADISNKVDKVPGKDLSTNDYTDEDKAEVDKVASKADINNPLSLAEAYRKSQGFIIHDYAASTGERYVLNPKDGVTLDDTVNGKSKIPSSYVVGNYVKESVANKVDKIEGKGLSTNDYTDEDKAEVDKVASKADINNPLSLSEANRKSQGFIIHDYAPSYGEKYVLNPKDGVTLDDTVNGKTKIPSSYVVAQYVKESVANKADISNPLSLSDTDITKAGVLIQHNYDSETQTEKYIARSIDVNNLSESGLDSLNIPTSRAVISWVKAYIESLNQSGGA